MHKTPSPNKRPKSQSSNNTHQPLDGDAQVADRDPKAEAGEPDGGSGDARRTAEGLAALLGVALTPRLAPSVVARLRKPLPGYSSLLETCADLLERDATVLAVGGVTPEGLRSLKTTHGRLRDLEGVTETVHRAIYEQRMTVDDQAMAVLLKVERRVHALAEDHPELLLHWKPLLDFLAAFRSNGARIARADE